MSRIKMQNVRICFPSLFSTASFGGEDTGKYAATFVLDKKEHAGIVNEIKAAMNKLTKEKFKGKLPPADKLCIKDGDDTERPEFEGALTVKASTKKRPLVLDLDVTSTPLSVCGRKITPMGKGSMLNLTGFNSATTANRWVLVA